MREMIISVAQKILFAAEMIISAAKTMILTAQIIVAEAKKMQLQSFARLILILRQTHRVLG
jgi:hypothetical protein